MGGMKWDRETVEPAHFIFPAKTIRERDINGLVLRETVSKGIPALSQYSIELVDTSGRFEDVVADSRKLTRGWSVAVRTPSGLDHTFRLSKADAVRKLVAIAKGAA